MKKGKGEWWNGESRGRVKKWKGEEHGDTGSREGLETKTLKRKRYKTYKETVN